MLTDMMCNYIVSAGRKGNGYMLTLSQGNERWLEVLESDFLDEFTTAPTEQWITLQSGKVAGTVRSASGGGSGAGNVTFVTIHEAGSVFRLRILRMQTDNFISSCSHMVPFDQPEAALVSCLHGGHPPKSVLTKFVFPQDMFTRWITDTPLA